MNVEDLTVGEVREIVRQFGGQSGIEPVEQPMPFEVGKCYLIRTVTMIQLGRLARIVGTFLVLDNAAWIADTGRFSDCLAHGTSFEVEPFGGSAIVNAGAIIDAAEWTHPLLKEVL